MQTYYTFKDIRALERFYRNNKYIEGHLDIITVGNKVFTLHEYDIDGKVMSWGNKKHNQLIQCNTANRYESHKDAKFYRFYNYGLLRIDINYVQ